MLLGNSLYTKAINIAQVCVESRASLTEIPQEEKIAKMQSILDHHRSFLNQEGESESFRPKKRWRLSVQKVLAMFDNQLRVSFSPLGLKVFFFSKTRIDAEFAGAPKKWPGFSNVSDQGGDMVSKIHACLYHTVVQMNLWEFWDVLHGVNRDIWLNIGHTEMKPLSLLHLMVMNLAHGPDETDLRYKQTTDFMNDHYDHSSAEISPCFQEHYPEMIKEIGHLCARQDGESMMQAMWRYCKANSVYNKGVQNPHCSLWCSLGWWKRPSAVLEQDSL